MLNALLAGLTLLAGRPAAAAPAAPAAFSVVLEATAGGWAARCDTGCAWRRAAFTCPGGCAVVVDEHGIRTVVAAEPAPAAFAFVAERTADGVRARARQGTAWREVAWGCRADTACRARLDAAGVDGSGAAR